MAPVSQELEPPTNPGAVQHLKEGLVEKGDGPHEIIFGEVGCSHQRAGCTRAVLGRFGGGKKAADVAISRSRLGCQI